MNPRDLKVIILDNPYDQLADALVQKIFPKCLELRVRGFRSRYDDGVLPFDTSDFFATHILVGTGSLDNFSALLGFKQFTLSRCEHFKATFAPLALMKQLNLTEHAGVIESILGRCRKESREISYLGSLVMNPEVKTDKVMSSYLLDLFIVLQYFFANEFNIQEGIVGTTLRFKTDRLARTLGYKPLASGDKILDPVAVPFAQNDLSQFHHRIGFAKATQDLALNFKEVWEQVIYLGMNRDQHHQAAA
jgi:hypothetical protein